MSVYYGNYGMIMACLMLLCTGGTVYPLVATQYVSESCHWRNTLWVYTVAK